jgi:hypothetical protein
MGALKKSIASEAAPTQRSAALVKKVRGSLGAIRPMTKYLAEALQRLAPQLHRVAEKDMMRTIISAGFDNFHTFHWAGASPAIRLISDSLNANHSFAV